MPRYRWNAEALGAVFAVPSLVADRLLTLASPEQLRVLLWFSRQGQTWDAAACSAALGLAPDECEGCLRFWAEQGVLSEVGQPVTVTEPAPEKTPVARAAAVKPTWPEVLKYQQEHREFTAFLQEVSARLGRTLNHGDNATLLYLITTAGLPTASVMMAVGYAMSVGKPSIRYIESLALGWADEEIVTPEQVDGKIRQLQQAREAAQTVERMLALPRALNAAQAKLAVKWLMDWHFSETMLQHAYTLTLDNCDKFSPAYMDKILERWHSEGVTQPDRIPAPVAKKKGAASTNPENSSLNSEAFEEQLLKYRPKFDKNKKTNT
ncbi:MAG: hypothetical protein E7527_01735 [Ruminococcaceae bacterium]|nr:hypothetical protein [Oscillospiraceae bacterium]